MDRSSGRVTIRWGYLVSRGAMTSLCQYTNINSVEMQTTTLSTVHREFFIQESIGRDTRFQRNSSISIYFSGLTSSKCYTQMSSPVTYGVGGAILIHHKQLVHLRKYLPHVGSGEGLTIWANAKSTQGR